MHGELTCVNIYVQQAVLKIVRNLMRKSVKKIWNVISTVLVAIVVIIALLLVGARVFGLQVYAVLSGSMEPTYHVGSIIYVKSVDPSEIKVGDPITFVMNEELTVATHRVVRIDAENSAFYTKGDANDDPDAAPVHFNNLLGKPVFTIPYLGYISSYVQSPPGIYIAVGVGVLLLALAFLPDMLDGDKKEKQKK